MKNKKKPWLLSASGTERKRFAKMSKEDRLKSVCWRYIEIAFSIGKVVGANLKEKKYRKKTLQLEHWFKGSINREATWALKRAGVLPLEKKAA